ncbi:hypothetical protein FRC04_006241 [Tulasnella sp. 424]|nr:hypothetical protein FRC04_006241 [Tulasnella sp. 424]
MPPAHLRAFLLCYAQQIATLNRISNYNLQLDRLTTLINQLAGRLETSFELSPMQKTNLASIVKDVMVQKSRTSYIDMYLKVLTIVNAEALSLALVNLSDANKKKLTTFILHSIKGGKTRCSLSQFLFRIGQGDWFRNRTDRDSPRLRIQFAIYRCLAFNNLNIISTEIDEDNERDDGELSNGDDDEDRPRKRRRTSSGSVPSSRRGKKKSGSPAWWDFVANWFMQCRKEWGLDMNNSGWSQYVQDTMIWERTNFPEPAVFEPITTTPSPSTSSTQGIFGALYASSSSSTSWPSRLPLLRLDLLSSLGYHVHLAFLCPPSAPPLNSYTR